MKTRDLVGMLLRNGWTFKRRGGNHDIYVKGFKRESVPYGRDVDDGLAKAIISRNNLK
jgi:mRNA interferase HicA